MKNLMTAMVFLGLVGTASAQLDKPKGGVADKVGGAKDKAECGEKAKKLAQDSAEKNCDRTQEQRVEITVEITVKITTTIKTVDDRSDKLATDTGKRKHDKAGDIADKCKKQNDKVDKTAKKCEQKSKNAKKELDEREELYNFLVELNDTVNSLDEVINLTLDLAIELDDKDLFVEAVELYAASCDLAELMFDLGLIYGEMCWTDWDEASRDQQCEWLSSILVNWFAVDDED